MLQDLHYQYDHIGNITEIEQTAKKPTWFGGPYIQTHQYDVQNRLIRADMLSDDIGLYSNYNLSYSPSGMVGNKTCDDMLWDYWYGYGKNSNGSPINHQVRSIYDLYNDNTSFLQRNADGQLQTVVRPCTGDMRHHWWNEAGLLVASIDNASCGYYGYDGNGNRAYKLTGQSVQDQYNAGEWQYHVNFNDAVLYVNPYFVVTPKGYTKYYYNGSQRIASKIGRISDLPTDIIDTSVVARERIANAQAYMASILGATEKIDISTGDIADIDGNELEELQWQCLDTNTIVFHITLQSDTNMLLPVLNRDTGFPTNALDIYYYHADHLGSASWITNKEGTPIEYIHYMPYGELWYNWQASSYNERFKFTGKERDMETGYDYFGARFYSPTLLHWLAPDPLAGKYPDISPYAYCKWNPLKYVDPNGQEVMILIPSTQTTHYNAAKNYQKYHNSPTNLTIIAHGTTPTLKNYATGIFQNKDIKPMRSNNVANLIRQNSSLWKDDASKQKIVILSACYTGKVGKQIDGSVPSFGQQLSADLKQSYSGDVYVAAPEGAVYTETGFGDILGDLNIFGYPYIDGTYTNDSKSEPSQWNIYKNGEFVKSIKQVKIPTTDQILE